MRNERTSSPQENFRLKCAIAGDGYACAERLSSIACVATRRRRCQAEKNKIKKAGFSQNGKLFIVFLLYYYYFVILVLIPRGIYCVGDRLVRQESVCVCSLHLFLVRTHANANTFDSKLTSRNRRISG